MHRYIIAAARSILLSLSTSLHLRLCLDLYLSLCRELVELVINHLPLVKQSVQVHRG